MLGLRISLALVGGPAPAGYMRTLTPFLPEPDVIQFRNTPQVSISVIQVFQDTNANGILDAGETDGVLVFRSTTPDDNLCPTATSSTATLFLSLPEASLPGGC
jgi:hypothetical protein